jgi:hypothetical protein
MLSSSGAKVGKHLHSCVRQIELVSITGKLTSVDYIYICTKRKKIGNSTVQIKEILAKYRYRFFARDMVVFLNTISVNYAVARALRKE